MEKNNDHQKHPYSWHQATVLLLVPYETSKEDIVVVIERNHLLAGVRGQQPIVKGRLYSNVDTVNSAWQLEPRTSRLSARERTTSTISTASTQSSYAFVSDPEISSSFAASLESGQVSDSEEPVISSPALSSPISSSADERVGPAVYQRQQTASSGPASPRLPTHALSSFSSLESLHSHSGRLLTLHLEKDQPIIWPSLIVGPVSEELSPYAPMPIPNQLIPEHKYNMDPTSLVLLAIELHDIREDKEEAFEYFVRAWHQAHLPSAAVKLVAYYLPIQTSMDHYDPEKASERGSVSYYVHSVGGPSGLGQLFMEAGLLHLEGAATILLSASYSVFSSIRIPQPQSGDSGTEAWRRDREMAMRFFDRARVLNPGLEIPVLPLESEASPGSTHELEMPSIEVYPSAPQSVHSGEESHHSESGVTMRRRRQKKDELIFMDDVKAKDDMDSAWYLYIPSLVGAGTALLVVGVVGALSFSSWRRNQGS
ncbi:hypothetical protein SERLADRAFT_449067 [Serpula lacrymans var. lacrymans S7.9]|uniref:CS domain-containing protein n=1 Tax=Serpula lacrymans var. lacrymans (strain S7.9) TaxID=578457 RepID=F8NW40_SERL9|nr:uncharacterized protein SERLADRAFT_449067 [Serpula lacrymans var. lacrymans S7.9]EGO24297.1 hypothetical protein SERLADRAFT_449067 [Serpula lacrymans var. lacrymans S7.9]